jgi:hypothetical protein
VTWYCSCGVVDNLDDDTECWGCLEDRNMRGTCDCCDHRIEYHGPDGCDEFLPPTSTHDQRAARCGCKHILQELP